MSYLMFGVSLRLCFLILQCLISLSLSRYKNDPEVLAMTNLIAAYQRNEILEFEKILKVCSSGNS